MGGTVRFAIVLVAAVAWAGCGSRSEPTQVSDLAPTTAQSAGSPSSLEIDACAVLPEASVVRFTQTVTGIEDLTVKNVGPDTEYDIDCYWDFGTARTQRIGLAVYLDAPTDKPACGFTGTNAPRALGGLSVPAYTLDLTLVTASTPHGCLTLQRGGPADAVTDQQLESAWIALLSEAVASLS